MKMSAPSDAAMLSKKEHPGREPDDGEGGFDALHTSGTGLNFSS